MSHLHPVTSGTTSGSSSSTSPDFLNTTVSLSPLQSKTEEVTRRTLNNPTETSFTQNPSSAMSSWPSSLTTRTVETGQRLLTQSKATEEVDAFLGGVNAVYRFNTTPSKEAFAAALKEFGDTGENVVCIHFRFLQDRYYLKLSRSKDELWDCAILHVSAETDVQPLDGAKYVFFKDLSEAYIFFEPLFEREYRSGNEFYFDFIKKLHDRTIKVYTRDTILRLFMVFPKKQRFIDELSVHLKDENAVSLRIPSNGGFNFYYFLFEKKNDEIVFDCIFENSQKITFLRNSVVFYNFEDCLQSLSELFEKQ